MGVGVGGLVGGFDGGGVCCVGPPDCVGPDPRVGVPVGLADGCAGLVEVGPDKDPVGPDDGAGLLPTVLLLRRASTCS